MVLTKIRPMVLQFLLTEKSQKQEQSLFNRVKY